jgi:hypothetical protein
MSLGIELVRFGIGVMSAGLVIILAGVFMELWRNMH